MVVIDTLTWSIELVLVLVSHTLKERSKKVTKSTLFRRKQRNHIRSIKNDTMIQQMSPFLLPLLLSQSTSCCLFLLSILLYNQFYFKPKRIFLIKNLLLLYFNNYHY